MEKPWEERLKEQQEKDREERERIEKEQHLDKLNKLKQPHITNLNEDSLLTGQLHYSLATLTQQPIHIGRSDGNPVPTIILRGLNILPNHAYLSLDERGEIRICV
jgi:hypothetical protein